MRNFANPNSRPVADLVGSTLLSLLAALAAAGLLIAVFLGSKVLTVLLAGAFLVGVLFVLTRNHRLFCLWGAVMTAPLAISKSFAIDAHMGGASAYSIEPLDFFLLLLVVFILRDLTRGQRPKLRFSPVAFWWGGLMLLGVLTMIMGPLRQLAAQEVLRMAKCFLLFLVILNECLRRRQIMHVIAGLVVSIAIQSVIALIQGAFHVDLHLQVLGEGTAESIAYAARATYAGSAGEAFRVNGLMGHPNLLAAYLSMLLPICFALLFSRVPRLYKFGIGAVTLMGTLALVVTLSLQILPELMLY